MAGLRRNFCGPAVWSPFTSGSGQPRPRTRGLRCLEGGFTAQELQAASIDSLTLNAAGFTDAEEIHTTGIAELKAAGFTAQEDKAASLELGVLTT